jgi:sulfur transfer protein SufE
LLLAGFGLESEISPGRRNGLSSMIARIRQFAAEALE